MSSSFNPLEVACLPASIAAVHRLCNMLACKHPPGPFTPVAAKIPLAVCFALLGGLLPAACLEGAAAHAPSQAQVAMASGFVAQGAALGSVLGPPLLAAVTSALGDWESAWWIMLVCPGLGLAVVAGVRRADACLARPLAAA